MTTIGIGRTSMPQSTGSNYPSVATLCLTAAALLMVSAADAGAQDTRLAARLDAITRDAVAAIVDSARSAGLPTEPLIDKALEGTTKRAPGDRIVMVVRSLLRELSEGRAALGASSSEPEIIAAAGALHAGASATVLARLRELRRFEALTVPLAVLTDLIARGVPADTASAAVLALARAAAPDGEFVALKRNVEKDIFAGAPPAIAATVRTHGVPPGKKGSPTAVDAAGPGDLTAGAPRKP